MLRSTLNPVYQICILIYFKKQECLCVFPSTKIIDLNLGVFSRAVRGLIRWVVCVYLSWRSMGLGRYLSALMRKKVWLSEAWSPLQGLKSKGPVGPEILFLFVLPKEDVIGLHDREKHRQEEVEIGPKSSTLIPISTGVGED